MKRTIMTAVLVALSVVSADVFATDVAVYAQGAYSNLHTLRRGGLYGPGGSVGIQLQFAEFWGAAVDVGASTHFENADAELPATSVAFTSAQLRYYVDVFEYVPYIGIGPAFFFSAPEVADQEGSSLGAKFTVGMDKRMGRSWSLGVQGDMFALSTDLSRYPIYSMVGLRVVWHFRL